MVKNPPANAGDAGDAGSIPGLRRFLGVGNGNPSVFFLGKSHGQKNLMGYSPWGCTESYMTKSVYIHICICVYVYTYTQILSNRLGPERTSWC